MKIIAKKWLTLHTESIANHDIFIALDIKRLTFNLIQPAILAFCAVFAAVACSEETEIERSGAGRITPVLTIDGLMTNASGNAKDVGALLPDASLFAFALESHDSDYSHQWQSISDYPAGELLRPGAYKATASYNNEFSEGIDCPYFLATTLFTISSGEEKEILLTAELASSAFELNIGPKMQDRFSSVSATLHSEGFSYVTVDATEDGIAFLHPGKTTIGINLTTLTGESLSLNLATVDNALPKRLYDVTIECNDAESPQITATIDGNKAGEIIVTPELIASPGIQIEPTGFSEGEILKIAEGNKPDKSVGFSISGSNAQRLLLTTVAPSLTIAGWPSEIDLCHASVADFTLLESKGVVFERNDSGSITGIDVTELIGHLRATEALSEAQFVLLAQSASGKLSQPVKLDIDIEPVDIAITSMSDIVLGLNRAEIILISHTANFSDNLVIQALGVNSEWTDCAIESISETAPAEYAVSFTVPQLTNAMQKVRVIYCGNEVASAVLRRVSPEFDIEVDPYALSAIVRIRPKDEKQLSLITSLAKIYVDGKETLGEQRDRDAGLLHIGSLVPNTSYTIQATLIDNPKTDDFTKSVKIHTERTLQVNNSNFEDHGDGPNYKNLPSGGRYSQSIIDIFNRQNYTSYDLQQPRGWANTNAKTFNKSAKNPNTWYMAPSVFSDLDNVEGYFAVVLRSVAWDLNGEEIKPYRQQANQFLPYNPNVPYIRYRAAGKVFLGSYSFDPLTVTETYNEGIEFPSRPVAINGNYHFTPAPNALSDCGLITVEVLGQKNGMEISIARNSVKLTPALTYTAFSVPLSYNDFGVKATKLKIMLSSSIHIGSIEEETAKITTFPDPQNATSFGGTLWVEDLTLSYF